MEIKEKTSEIIEIFRSEKDELVKMLEIIDLSKDSDIQKVIEIYKKIKAGEIKIATVITSVELTKTQTTTITKKLKEEFKDELIFMFKIDKNIKGGIEIRVGDLLVELNTDVF